MMYQTSKLAREISEYLELPKIKVWDILDDLGYTPQELSGKDIMKWICKVNKEISLNK